MLRLHPGRFVVAAAALLGACVADDPQGVAGIEVREGYEIEEVRSGLVGPTQLTKLSDGRFVVAELNGGEREGTGRILAFGESGGDDEILFDGLLTPTGVAEFDGDIWVMEQRTLSRGSMDGGRLVPVLDDLPFNGRSETTLTAVPGERLLYGTTGALRGGEALQGSGTLWSLGPGEGRPQPLATGFKNAYGHAVSADGTLWSTEISDGTFDGEQAPDELVPVTPGEDQGWPRCIGDRTPVGEYGGSADECAVTPVPQALFAARSTPTSVAIAPWDSGTLVVALWVERRIVTVPTDRDGAPHEPRDLVTGSLRPQHLLADGDRLLVVDLDGGRILAIEQR